MALDRTQAEDLVASKAAAYALAQLEVDVAHEELKEAVRLAKTEAKMTQQQIADKTVVGDGSFSLSRQRISQILHEND